MNRSGAEDRHPSGRQNNTPKDVHVLVPGTSWCVTLGGDRVFAGVTELRALRGGEEPGYSQWTQCHHKGPYKMGAGRSERRKEG